MIARRLRHLLGPMAVVAVVACTPKPTQAPDRLRPEATDDARAADRPPPPAPRGPDISDKLLATARVGALNHLDRRLAALMPSIVPPALVQGFFTRRLLPELARDIGLNALALEALDFTRSSVFGLLMEKPSMGKPVPKPRFVVLLPLRGDARLVVDALKESWPESRQEPWGGVHVRRGGQSLVWVQARDGYVVVAPSAQLLDSALRALAPLTEGVGEGTLHVQVRFAQLVDILQGPIRMVWGMLKGRMASDPQRGSSGSAGIVKMILPLFPKLVPYVTSIQGLDLFARIADAGWSFRMKVTPTPGGRTAGWLGRLRPADVAGLALLPPEATLVSVDRQGEAARLLGSKLFGQTVDWVVTAIGSKDLPAEVRDRGLMDRPRAVSLPQYRRELRDLNLADYDASYAIYKLLFALKALRGHLEGTAPRLVKASTGQRSLAFYATGGKVGQVRVEDLKDVATHRSSMVTWASGVQRHGRSLVAALWDAVPGSVRKVLREALGIRTNPMWLTYKPMALRVGRVSVSSLSFGLKLPSRAAAGQGGASPSELRGPAKMMDMLTRVVDHLFGKSELTYAWAYVGNRRVSAWGHNWQARMTSALQAVGKGAPSSPVLADPLFESAQRDLQGESTSFTLVSGARLVLGALAGFEALFPKMASQPGPGQMILGQLKREANQAQTATLFREVREEGTYQVELRVPNEDIKTWVLGAGMLFGFVRSSPAPSRGVVRPVPAQPTIPAPGHPSVTSPPDSPTQP